MDFLREENRKPKILRTRLYGDQDFSRFELEILHTPIFQRLYNLKQLGFADRVFPDAVHSRFNHVLGVAEMVERMTNHLVQWLNHTPQVFEYAATASESTETISGPDLAKLLGDRKKTLRLMGLLHDLTHAAYGHTLEDEVSVFEEKHDDPLRQQRFFDALVAQLVYIWCTSQRRHTFDAREIEELANLQTSSDLTREIEWANELRSSLSEDDRKQLAKHLRDLEAALVLLSNIEYAHGDGTSASMKLLAGRVALAIHPATPSISISLSRDLFMIDLVGNTVCADLLDYARRDADNAGLKVQFDDRFLRYLCIVSVKDQLSPTGRACLRTGIQIFTDKMRHDVLSEMSGVLKARYLINERVLFHPTKCAAGSMLGTAVQLLGLGALPGWLQTLGDQEFVRMLLTISRNVDRLCEWLAKTPGTQRPSTWKEVCERVWPTSPEMGDVITGAAERIAVQGAPNVLTDDQLADIGRRSRAARNVLWKLSARRFPKLAYRLRDARHTGGESDETIAIKYSRAIDRYELERRIEAACNIPTGTVFVHCPVRKTSMKVAEALVVGNDPKKAALLRDVVKVSPEGLEPYQKEIRSIERMYMSIWQFHAFLDPTFWHKRPLVEWAIERELGFPNDQLLKQELRSEDKGLYQLVAGPLRDEIPPAAFQDVVTRIDELSSEEATSPEVSTLRQTLRKIVKDVVADSLVDIDALDTKQAKTLSQAQFRAGCREIFLKYLLGVGDAKLLDDHHNAFIARNEKKPPERRYALLATLKKYDLPPDLLSQGIAHRGPNPFTEQKLLEIERDVDKRK